VVIQSSEKVAMAYMTSHSTNTWFRADMKRHAKQTMRILIESFSVDADVFCLSVKKKIFESRVAFLSPWTISGKVETGLMQVGERGRENVQKPD
jgi:hypothetical protein